MGKQQITAFKVFDYCLLWRRTLALIWSAVPGLTVLWTALIIAQGAIPAATVYLTKQTIDAFVAARERSGDFSDLDQTIYYCVLTGISLLAAETLQHVADWTRTAQAEYFSDHLKDLMHRKSAALDLEFYESAEYHDLAEQARGDSQTKPLALLESFGSSVQSAITLASFAALLFAYGWAIPLILIAGAVPGLLISLKYDRIFHSWWKRTANDRRWLMYFDSMLSHASAAAEMRLFDLSGRFRERFQTVRARLRNEKLRLLRRQSMAKALANAFAMIAGAGVLGWISLKVFYKTATLGDLAVFYQIFTRGQAMMRALFGGVGQSVNNTLYLESLFAYLDLPSKIVSPSEIVAFPSEIKEGVRFRGVTFRYPGADRNAVERFDLFIPAGKIVAIVGVNGAGKSTLVKLLSRFYDPQAGAVEIDDIDIRNFDLKTLRRNVSVLFQFPMQFHETAADNIALGDAQESKTDLRKLESAARSAGASGFLSRLPDGYQTLLGKWFVKGCELSGGEWQRVALARAYYRQSRLIVLDEPTSFMDSWAEADWFDRFRELARSRTALVITHRFTIAMRADVIYVLDGGRLVEAGTHADLLAAGGFYAESWQSQLKTADDAGSREKSAVGIYDFAGRL